MAKYSIKNHLSDSPTSEIKIDNTRAITIARNFLTQYHSPVILKSAYLDGKTWVISMEVGLLDEDIIQVTIDSETGRVLGYTSYLE